MSSSSVEKPTQKTSVASKIDWDRIFDDWENGDYIPRENLPRVLVYNSEYVSSEAEAKEAVRDAINTGIVAMKRKGVRLATSSDSDPDTGTPTPDVTVEDKDEPESDVHPTVQQLREIADTTPEYVASMESVLSEVLTRMDNVEDRMSTVETRMDDVEETDQDREGRVNKIFDTYNEVRTGLTELQLRRLEDGELLSSDAVDVDALKELGYDPIIVGDNRDAVRLPADEQDDGDTGSSRDLPDFSQLCTLEELRIKNKLKLRSREDIENDTAYKYRALVVWDDAGLLDVSDNPDEIAIPSSKVREKLLKIEDISRPSSYEIAKRTMEKMTPEGDNWSDGVFRFDGSGNENRIVADVEEYTTATVQRFSTSAVTGEGGASNTVVR